MEAKYPELVRNITTQVLQKLGTENVNINLNLCMYLVSLKLLQHPKIMIDADCDLIDSITETCLNELRKNSVCLRTLQLQLLWNQKHHTKGEIKQIHHETIFKNVLPIMTDITERNITKAVNKDEIYKKIVVFIIMFAGLGSPTQQSIIRETQVALHSIFKNTEIDNFLTLAKPVKEQQLVELARLVTGIRLFNKDCKKREEGIEDLPLVLTEGVKATKERITTFKDKVDKRIDCLVITLYQHLANEQTDASAIKAQKGFNVEELENFKRLLVYSRQIEIYLKDIIGDLDESSLTISELIEKFQSTLLRVHDLVRYRVAVATNQVFPLFLRLSDVWVEMQEEVDVLSEINNNYVDLSSAYELFSTPLECMFDATLDNLQLPWPANEVLQEDESKRFHEGVKICTFSSDSHQGFLQYEGFCAWSLVRMNGALIKGNISIGVLSFENRLYSFVSAETAYEWAETPKDFIKAAVNVVKTKPELINLLNIFNDLTADDDELATVSDRKRETENKGVQTLLHPIDSYICKDYTYSEWQLKKRALKLASITRCATKSQQTTQRSLDIGVQVSSIVCRQRQKLN